MAKRKRKLSVAGMIIIGIAFVLVVFLLVLLMKYFFLDRNKTEYKDKPNKDKVVEKVDTIEDTSKIDYGISLLDYKVYDTNEVEFSFIIADIKFNNESVKYDFADFKTSEGIILSDSSIYISKLNSVGFYPSILEVITSVPEKTKSFTGKVLIPFKNKSLQTLKLQYLDGETFEFDLTKNIGDITVLTYNEETEITDKETFKITIKGVEDLTGMYLLENGEEYQMSSRKVLYGLICDLDSLGNESVLIESAFFEDLNGFIYRALPGTVKSNDIDNLVGLSVKKSAMGAILFTIVDSEIDENTLYLGKLHIKLNNDVNDYIINVSIN